MASSDSLQVDGREAGQAQPEVEVSGR